MSEEIERNRKIGERIREKRLEMGLSQSALARELGVSMQSVSLWENGKTMIGSSSVVAIAKKLKCDIYWLLGEDPQEKKDTKAIENKENNVLTTLQFNPFLSDDELDESMKDEVVFLKRAYQEMDNSRRIELLRKAVELWKESVNETLSRYEKELKNRG
ncbi:helix-turn-helix domain-containing protein [Salmonella enterica]|uniref:helix-turn-helix domain-containing protein n=1 Tax=Salmonella enterica TaxID=28901 RepID=UPI0009AE7B8B|nr:helix-turn-helix domain-containing protein [Salmonella enterica]